jgi:hypothetical protein
MRKVIDKFLHVRHITREAFNKSTNLRDNHRSSSIDDKRDESNEQKINDQDSESSRHFLGQKLNNWIKDEKENTRQQDGDKQS